jgi:hypothetical protein
VIEQKNKYRPIIEVLLQESGNLGIYSYKISGRKSERRLYRENTGNKATATSINGFFVKNGVLNLILKGQ